MNPLIELDKRLTAFADAFLGALQLGQAERCCAILEGKSADPEAAKFHTRALEVACGEVRGCSSAIVRHLLVWEDSHADPNGHQFSPLDIATSNCHTAAVVALLDDGRADPRTSSVASAVGSAYKAPAELLDALLNDSRVKIMPLRAAASLYKAALQWPGARERVDVLLRSGKVDPRARGSYSLQCAAVANRPDVVELLLADGRASLDDAIAGLRQRLVQKNTVPVAISHKERDVRRGLEMLVQLRA